MTQEVSIVLVGGENFGNLTLTGVETVTIASGGNITNTIGDISLTTGAPDLHEFVTLRGNQSLDTGSIVDFASGSFLNYNDLVISIVNSAVVNIDGEVNAVQILAATSGGVVMHAPDFNTSRIVSDNGDLITGSSTGANVLIGSTGNDAITGTASAGSADTIATGGGTITLAQQH